MSSPLALAIDALSDPEVALSAALRRLYVVAGRIGADDLAATIMTELKAYPPSVPVPIYREAGSAAPHDSLRRIRTRSRSRARERVTLEPVLERAGCDAGRRLRQQME